VTHGNTTTRYRRYGSTFDFLAIDFMSRTERACKDVDRDVFFPIDVPGFRAAQAICETCPIKALCLEYALEANEEHGVWGGTSERERKRLRPAWRAERTAGRIGA
jgi:WhiB family transcriptional regulator, redox-sensing transcriptional regulator